MKKFFVFCLLFCAVIAFAKTAAEYYGESSFLYIENRLPSAEILCEEGLSKYPQDQKLQMLLDRIREAKEEQKKENQKNDKSNENKDKQDDSEKNEDQENNENQNQENSNNENSENSSSSNSENNAENENQNGNSSSSANGESSSSASNQDSQNENTGESSSSVSGNESPQNVPEPYSGQMTPEEASQLLKDFDEQKGERKPWRPMRGQAYPEKDW